MKGRGKCIHRVLVGHPHALRTYSPTLHPMTAIDTISIMFAQLLFAQLLAHAFMAIAFVAICMAMVHLWLHTAFNAHNKTCLHIYVLGCLQKCHVMSECWTSAVLKQLSC
jgi:hypothetical protein